MSKYWTTTEVADYLGLSRKSVYMWLHRAGVQAVRRQPGNHGENLYDPEEIKKALGGRAR